MLHVTVVGTRLEVEFLELDEVLTGDGMEAVLVPLPKQPFNVGNECVQVVSTLV